MDVSHLENLSKEEALKKATVIWGIKESIFKIKNIEGISFKDHIFLFLFELSVGKCDAELRFENQVEHFNIQYQKVDSYILVIAFKAN